MPSGRLRKPYRSKHISRRMVRNERELLKETHNNLVVLTVGLIEVFKNIDENIQNAIDTARDVDILQADAIDSLAKGCEELTKAVELIAAQTLKLEGNNNG